jgi:hypothetical protein
MFFGHPTYEGRRAVPQSIFGAFDFRDPDRFIHIRRRGADGWRLSLGLTRIGRNPLRLHNRFGRGSSAFGNLGSGHGRFRVDESDDGSNFNGLAFLNFHFDKRPGLRGGSLGVDLVGGNLEKGLVPFDRVTDLLQPLGNSSLRDGFPHLGHGNFDSRHRGPLRTAIRAGRRGRTATLQNWVPEFNPTGDLGKVKIARVSR